jgi:GNAT superfamily N-acetyltransferase
MPITIGQLSEQHWPTLRELRFAALTDAPHAFEASLEDEVGWGVVEWLSFVRNVAWFVASLDGQPIGLVGGLQRSEAQDEPEIISMWVAPPERGTGAADLLLQAVLQWARKIGAHSMALWVADGNAHARRLYERHGFRLTGERCPFQAGRTGSELRMRQAELCQPSRF